jgi:sulfur carrier protein ThiS
MPVQVFLSTTLRGRFPDYDAHKGVILNIEKDATVEDLLRVLGIPVMDVKIIMVNGRSAEPSQPLKGDERIGLFPPMGGG